MGPGQYTPDSSEGITSVADLPRPRIEYRSRNFRRRLCPRCGRSAFRNGLTHRTLHDLGDPCTGRPKQLRLTCSVHRCSRCRHSFVIDTTDLVPPGGHYTHRVVDRAVRLVVEDGLPYRAASWHLWRDHRVFVPFATVQNWVEAAEKKGARAPGG